MTEEELNLIFGTPDWLREWLERVVTNAVIREDKAITAKWVCIECYHKLNKEYECFSDANWMKIKCYYCGVNIGEFHLVNPPDELPTYKPGPEETK